MPELKIKYWCLNFLYEILGENTRNGSCSFILVSAGAFKHSCWFVLQIPWEFCDTPVRMEVQKAGLGANQFSINTSYISDGSAWIMLSSRHMEDKTISVWYVHSCGSVLERKGKHTMMSQL